MPIESMDYHEQTDMVFTVDSAGRFRSFRKTGALPDPTQIPVPLTSIENVHLQVCPHDSDLVACADSRSLFVCRASSASVMTTVAVGPSPPTPDASGTPERADDILPSSGGDRTSLPSWSSDAIAIAGLTWHPSEHRVASIQSDGRVVIWSALDGSELMTMSSSFYGGDLSLYWSPDGRHLATASGLHWRDGATGSVDIWDVSTGERIRSLDSARTAQSRCLESRQSVLRAPQHIRRRNGSNLGGGGGGVGCRIQGNSRLYRNDEVQP